VIKEFIFVRYLVNCIKNRTRSQAIADKADRI